ncbi:hypothetical protein, variant [Verruconis gallopava]|uniref:Protein ecm33 n=1 Tax=Verruconis gallopava TaxID=253628 RepID=A0A0D2AJY8_9PEZI|nr:uncharacterized protein PV09_09038 [Verruconis gallopava]XP_016209139.1 hypothetical protein, variant [Verruconis gallopava]KIV99268.1 hypothetical protein PV09_09038 [Verruconis gallopava]KIV99269.1 hypothetical protein, variant [Verruconis gallopava]
MAFLRYALPALAAAGSAFAQSNSCSTSATLTVVSPADASALSSCTTFSGSVAIATEAAGDFSFPSVREITGDLTATGATNVTSISADSIESIGGTFGLDNLQRLNTLNFQEITSVGKLDFSGLPNLNTLNFPQNIQSAQSLNIQNTFLSSLNGINLQSVESIYIANNNLLQDISFQVSNLTGTINVESNGDQLKCAFPNLITAANITFRDVPSISIPSLTNTTGSLGFYENTITTINAPNLTTVGGTLAINTNPKLTNISMPVLQTITGGLQVQNNTILEEVTFPALTTISGATDMYGNFTSVSLPALKDNRGGFNLQSTGNITASCDVFNNEHGQSSVIKGKYQCAGSLTNPGNSSTTATGSGSSSTKKSEAGDVRINAAAMGLSGLVAAMFAL